MKLRRWKIGRALDALERMVNLYECTCRTDAEEGEGEFHCPVCEAEDALRLAGRLS